MHTSKVLRLVQTSPLTTGVKLDHTAQFTMARLCEIFVEHLAKRALTIAERRSDGSPDEVSYNDVSRGIAEDGERLEWLWDVVPPRRQRVDWESPDVQ